MRFQREDAPAIFDEIRPLLEKHWREIAHFKDIELDPEWDLYRAMSEAGSLKCFTARTESGELVGYAIYFVRRNPHYRKSLQATQDILFLDPAHRGKGGALIRFADAELAADGVQLVYQHVKCAHNFGPLLERLGYEHVEQIYCRRLD